MAILIRLKEKIEQSAYARNLLTMISGNALVQFLPFFTAPINSRIYTPYDYGVTAMYSSVAALLIIFVSSHYIHSVMLAKKYKDIINSAFLCFLITCFIVSVSVLLIAVIPNRFIDKLVDARYHGFIYFIPFSIFFAGVNSLLDVWNNKMGKYRLMAFSRVTQGVAGAVITIVLGLLLDGPYGLFVAIITTDVIGISVSLGYFIKQDRQYLKLLSLQRALYIAKRDKRLLIYSFPGDIMNNYINLLPVFILESIGGKSVVGAFQFAKRILGAPIELVGRAILEVFRKKAIDDYHREGNCLNIFTKTFKLLSGISVFPTLFLLIFAPYLFQIFFGEKWIMAGQFTQILAILYFFKIVASPLSYMYFLAKRNKEDLITQIVLVVLEVLALIISFSLFNNVFITLGFYAGAYCLKYLWQLYRSYTFAQGEI